jgi:hypothetical protein
MAMITLRTLSMTASRVRLLLYSVFLSRPQRFSQVRPEFLIFCGGYISHDKSQHCYYYKSQLLRIYRFHTRHLICTGPRPGSGLHSC